jgi:hypothetical protein
LSCAMPGYSVTEPQDMSKRFGPKSLENRHRKFSNFLSVSRTFQKIQRRASGSSCFHSLRSWEPRVHYQSSCMRLYERFWPCTFNISRQPAEQFGASNRPESHVDGAGNRGELRWGAMHVPPGSTLSWLQSFPRRNIASIVTKEPKGLDAPKQTDVRNLSYK